MKREITAIAESAQQVKTHTAILQIKGTATLVGMDSMAMFAQQAKIHTVTQQTKDMAMFVQPAKIHTVIRRIRTTADWRQRVIICVGFDTHMFFRLNNSRQGSSP
ncbi:MAG: hypothetical protein PUP93_27875 [Rhizonema sp. NSF051]|nr:hypothetical protein [Rhizonema sp. NSF051]